MCPKDLVYEPYIQLLFDRIPKTRHGVRAGRSDLAELHLLSSSASNIHFSITFNDDYYLIVRDMESLSGTEVIYDTQGCGRLSDFDWIVGGSDFLDKVDNITIKVTKSLQFRLVVPRHDTSSESYRAKVDRFRAGTADAEQLNDLDLVGLDRIKTMAPQSPPAPVDAVTIKKSLGSGGFGEVFHVWNVSTGTQYALKQPKKGMRYTKWRWEQEVVIMQRNDHVSSPKTVSLLIMLNIPNRSTLSHC